MSQRILIFANPIAGRGRGGTIARRVSQRLRLEGYEVITFTDRPESLPDNLIDGPVRAAVVIGGDGTLRAVAERLFLRGDAGGAEVPLLIIPLGTANLMYRHLGLAWNDDHLDREVSQTIAAGRIARIDTARANGRLFLLMAGIGFDAHVVHELDKIRKGPISYASYALPAAMAISGYRYPPLTIHVDSRTVFGPAPAVAFVGNVSEYGTGFPILPHARPDDGLLDVCILPCSSRLDVFRLFMMAASGDHLHAEGVVYTKGRHITLHSSAADPVPIQLDGDSAGHTPLEIDLLPIRLPFMVRSR